MIKRNNYRKAIFAVVYSTDSGGKIEYLILKRKKHWKGWEFTKGKVERFESKKRTVRREVYEETGLKALKIKNLKIKGRYKYNKALKDRPGIVGQTYHLFAVKVEKGDGKIKIDPLEHFLGRWVSFKEACRMLTWQNQKECLKVVDNWLNSKR